ncbi:hypothetical protein [Amycolatopsis sp. NPDC051102]|uniref:hypothetical protein n=1 Tax=Amycolatopsis sp. NPDC051102 TaxID=3155163 RepID=UPI00343A368C
MTLLRKLTTAALGATALVAATAVPASAAVAKPASAQDCSFEVLSDDGTFCFPQSSVRSIHVEHVYSVCAFIDTTYVWEGNPWEAYRYKVQRRTDPCDSYGSVPGNTTVVMYWN